MDIALSAGFPDSQNFSRHFKQHYGCPPAEYRRDLCPALRPQINILPILAVPSPLGEGVFVFFNYSCFYGVSATEKPAKNITKCL